MEATLIIIGVGFLLLLMVRPAAERRTIYVPVEVVEQSGGGLGCLLLVFVVVVLLLAGATAQLCFLDLLLSISTLPRITDPYIDTEYSFWGGLEGPGCPLGAPSRPPQRWGCGGGVAAPAPPPNM